MAIKKVKGSVPSAQSPRLGKHSAVSTRHSAKAKSISKPGSRNGSFHFPEVIGKVLEDVEFATASGYDVISLSFRDNTCMDFVIDTCFTVKADYLDRGHGDHRVLKKWPLMHCQR
jgi:hypothetical protein